MFQFSDRVTATQFWGFETTSGPYSQFNRRSWTHTTILAQHTTVTTMVQDSMTQSRNESHAIRETIQTYTQGLATQTDIRHINDLLERLLRSHSAQETTTAPRVSEIADENVAQPKVEVDHEDDLEAIIFFVIEALQGRRGIFADDSAQEICDALQTSWTRPFRLDFFYLWRRGGRVLEIATTTMICGPCG